MSALRALLRVELRELRRHRARTALIVALVAVPVAATVGGATLFLVTQPTAAEREAAAMGRADLRATAGPGAAGLARRAAAEGALPSGCRAVPIDFGTAEFARGGERAAAPFAALDPRELGPGGLAEGMLRIAAGRAPAGAGEVALSPALAAALAVASGETIHQGGRAHTVTGIVLDPEKLPRALALFALDGGDERTVHALLVAAPAGAADAAAEALRAAGLAVGLRAEFGEPSRAETAAIFVIGGFGLIEAGLVIAAAFAVGLRRRQREIGLLGASGATRGAIRLGILASSAMLSAAGGVLGAALGAAAAAALHPWLDAWNGRLNGPFEFSWPQAFGAALLGICAGVAAALLPALRATALAIREALSSRRPAPALSRAGLGLGAALAALAFGIVFWSSRTPGRLAGLGILAGSLLGVAGCGVCSPWLLGAAAKRASVLPLSWRLAVRDAGRFRARNGPVVTAVCAALSIAVMLGSIFRSVSQWSARRASGGGDPTEPERVFVGVVLALCLATALAVVFIATALSSVEAAADARTLRSVGAAPGLLRRHLAARAAYLALAGSLLALPAGLIPAAGVLSLANVPLGFALPWTELCVTALAFPILAYAGTLAYAAAAEVLRRPPEGELEWSP